MPEAPKNQLTPGQAIVKSLFLFACLFVISQNLHSLNPISSLDNFLIDQWKMSAGFPSDSIVTINQTPDGYLWFGTSKGLARFDGVRFSTASFSAIPQLFSQQISDCYVDNQGNLWIANTEGLTHYNYRTGEYKTYSQTDGLPVDGIRFVLEDSKGNIWLSFTTSYVGRLSKGKFTAFNEKHGLIGKKINTIIEIKKGQLLFGTSENGIFSFDAQQETFSPYPITGLGNARVNIMRKDHRDNLWIGTDQGLFVKNTRDRVEKYTKKDGLPGDYISAILEDSRGNFWVGDVNEGLAISKREPGRNIAFKNLLPDKKILCLFEDREKSIWIGTLESGIIRLKDRKFYPYSPSLLGPDEILFSIYRDRHDNMWLGTWSGKLYRCRSYNQVERIPLEGLPTCGISAICEDNAGNIWLGTNGKGIVQKKGNTFTRKTTHDGLADNQVTSIFADSMGNLWFATFDGLSIYEPGGQLKTLRAADGLPGKRVYNISEDSNRNIWVATDNGLSILTNSPQGLQIKQTIFKNIPVTWVYQDPAIQPGEKPVYWIATDGHGLKKISLETTTTSSIISFTKADGLLSDSLYRIMEDHRGYFWIMSNHGILRTPKNILNQFASGQIAQIDCTLFDKQDGLGSVGFNNEYSRHSALETAEGDYWFLTRKGISILNPAKIRLNKQPPQLLIEKISFNNTHELQHAQVLTRQQSPYTVKGKTSFSAYFRALTSLSPGKVKFKYRLEPQGELEENLGTGSKKWTYSKASVNIDEQSAHYHGLDWGTYTFQVTACNADGKWNEKGVTFCFKLEPYFYQSTSFKTLVFFLLLVIGGLAFYYYRKKSLEKHKKYKSSSLNDQYADTIIKKMKRLMEKEKIYCDSNLTLQALADMLSIKSYLLSQVLNEHLNKSFYDYINHYRIEETKRILETPEKKDLKMQILAGDVGFNTTAAFYKVFKKFTGKTPAQYRKEALRGK